VLPKVVTVSGRRNSGKTTWVCAIVAELRRRGVRVATVKRTHHDCFPPGKDTTRHLEADAQAVLLVSPIGSIHYQPWVAEPTLDELVLAHFDGYELVLAEGYRELAALKLVVGDDPAANTERLLRRLPPVSAQPDADLVAEVCDELSELLKR